MNFCLEGRRKTVAKKSEKMLSVNPERLKYARDYYADDIFEVAKKTKINVDKLNSYESGEDHPTYSELAKLADYYRQPLLFFFFNSVPQNDKMMVAFRGLEQSEQKFINKRVREMIEIANVYRLNLEELYQDEKKCLFLDIIKDEKVTKKDFPIWLREKLGITIQSQIFDYSSSAELLESFRNKLFDIGIYVFKDSFKEDDVSGLCLFDEKFPIILLNNKTTFNRQLFTLFHEVFHIFCHKNDIDYISDKEEQECNNFASEFLIPTKSLKSSLKNYTKINDEVIEELAKQYCVSKDAMAYKLYKLQKITKNSYSSIHRDFSSIRDNSKSAGGSYYYTKKAYLGEGYIRKVYDKFYQGKISISQVGLYTQMKPTTAKAFSSKIFGGGF